MINFDEWLKANEYELTNLTGGNKGFFINPKDRDKVFKYLEKKDLIKHWEYRGNYTYILITLKGVE